MTIYNPTTLESADYEQPDWIHIYNANVDKLNDDLLKIQSLVDVDVDKLVDGAVLRWSSADSKWKLVTYP